MFCTSASTSRRRLAAALVALVAGCAALPPKPLPPQVALETVRVARLTAADARIVVTLAVRNPNAYDLAVNALDASLALEGEPLLDGSLKAPAVLAAGADTRIDVEVRTTLAAVAAALDRLSRRTTVHYDLTGTAVVQDGLTLPFARRGDIPVGDLLGPRR